LSSCTLYHGQPDTVTFENCRKFGHDVGISMNGRSRASFRGALKTLLSSGLLLIVTGQAQPVRADPQHDLLFFLSLQGADYFSTSDPDMDQTDWLATADLLYTFNRDKFSFLAEYILSDEESELERLQAGWRLTDQSTFWLGRFHTVSKFWSTEYHHGQYLQTSISRPGVEQWEDESGPMPSHLTGLLLQHDIAVGNDSIFAVSFAAGLGPTFKRDELVPFDLLESGSEHGRAVNYRMAYRPDVVSSNQIGLAIAWNDIPVVSESGPNLASLRSIQQSTVSLFADWHWQKWRLLSSWVYFDNQLEFNGGDADDSFVSGYIQGEFPKSDEWTLFGRGEFSYGEDNSPYVQLLPAFVAHRYMLGVRWDFADAQSATLELANTTTQGLEGMHLKFGELRLQWSAVFP